MRVASTSLVRGIWTSNDGSFAGEAGAGGRASDLAFDDAESVEAKASEVLAPLAAVSFAAGVKVGGASVSGRGRSGARGRRPRNDFFLIESMATTILHSRRRDLRSSEDAGTTVAFSL
jgi:hypothetical protein